MCYVMMVLIAIATLLNGSVQAQNAQLSGVIALPAPQASALARQTPGYRSRLGGRGASAAVQGTSFSSVIISAHPLSFKAEVQPLAEPVRMTQEKIAFVPYIVPITAGTTVEFVNLDKVYHNVFSLTPGAKFNIGRKPTGDVVARRVDYVGQIKLFCDIHPRMNATILSLDTPYFAPADEARTYLLSELPPGEYEIRLYHPSLKGSTEKLELTANQKMVKDFTLGR